MQLQEKKKHLTTKQKKLNTTLATVSNMDIKVVFHDSSSDVLTRPRICRKNILKLMLRIESKTAQMKSKIESAS